MCRTSLQKTSRTLSISPNRGSASSYQLWRWLNTKWQASHSRKLARRLWFPAARAVIVNSKKTLFIFQQIKYSWASELWKFKIKCLHKFCPILTKKDPSWLIELQLKDLYTSIIKRDNWRIINIVEICCIFLIMVILFALFLGVVHGRDTKCRGLALAGGGAKGSYEAGAFDSFVK